jgi:NAD-dependent deacetylase
MDLPEIQFRDYREIVILTGAGVSVASGLRPYRGPGGLWTEGDTAQLANAAALERNPAAVWRLFGSLRPGVQDAAPNPAHLALAHFQERWKVDRSITLITQNIDGLHQRAGSDVVELHGSLSKTRCSRTECELIPFEDQDTHAESVPECPKCAAPLRPDIVLFNEPLPLDAAWKAKKSLRNCDLFLAIGTSGTVSPASSFVRSAAYVGARTILVNLEPMNPANPAFQTEIIGRAEELLPRLLRVDE